MIFTDLQYETYNYIIITYNSKTDGRTGGTNGRTDGGTDMVGLMVD